MTTNIRQVESGLKVVGAYERAIAIACALEEENAQLTALLTDACAFLTSEDAYDITELLEKAHALGIEVYDRRIEKGDKVVGLGRGGVPWPRQPVGTVTEVLDGWIRVQWDDSAVEDDMSRDDLRVVRQ